MPSLAPGEVIPLGHLERLLISLRGPGAARCEVHADPSGGEVRRASAGKFVIEAQTGTVTSLQLVSADDRIEGTVVVEFRAVGAGTPKDSVMLQELHVVGQRHVPLIEFVVPEDAEASVRSLVGARRPQSSGEAGAWVAATTRKPNIAILTDGSASCAYMDRDGSKELILGAVRQCLSDVLGVDEPQEFVVGSAAQGSQWLTPAGRRQVSDLYVSGVQIPWAELTEREIHYAVIISDDPLVSQPAAVTTSIPFALLLPQGHTRANAQDVDNAKRACIEQGGDLLAFSCDTVDIESTVRHWITQRLRAFVETEEGAAT